MRWRNRKEGSRRDDRQGEFVSRRRFLRYAGAGVVGGILGAPFAEVVLRKSALRVALGSEVMASGEGKEVKPVYLQLKLSLCSALTYFLALFAMISSIVGQADVWLSEEVIKRFGETEVSISIGAGDWVATIDALSHKLQCPVMAFQVLNWKPAALKGQTLDILRDIAIAAGGRWEMEGDVLCLTKHFALIADMPVSTDDQEGWRDEADSDGPPFLQHLSNFLFSLEASQLELFGSGASILLNHLSQLQRVHLAKFLESNPTFKKEEVDELRSDPKAAISIYLSYCVIVFYRDAFVRPTPSGLEWYDIDSNQWRSLSHEGHSNQGAKGQPRWEEQIQTRDKIVLPNTSSLPLSLLPHLVSLIQPNKEFIVSKTIASQHLVVSKGQWNPVVLLRASMRTLHLQMCTIGDILFLAPTHHWRNLAEQPLRNALCEAYWRKMKPVVEKLIKNPLNQIAPFEGRELLSLRLRQITELSPAQVDAVVDSIGIPSSIVFGVEEHRRKELINEWRQRVKKQIEANMSEIWCAVVPIVYIKFHTAKRPIGVGISPQYNYSWLYSRTLQEACKARGCH